jgi:hypothetical protein
MTLQKNMIKTDSFIDLLYVQIVEAEFWSVATLKENMNSFKRDPKT